MLFFLFLVQMSIIIIITKSIIAIIIVVKLFNLLINGVPNLNKTIKIENIINAIIE